MSRYPVEKLFRYSLGRHSGDVSEPSQPAVSNKHDQWLDACSFQHLCIADVLFWVPTNMQDLAKTALMERFKSAFQGLCGGPGLTSVEENREYCGSVYPDLRACLDVPVVPDPVHCATS